MMLCLNREEGKENNFFFWKEEWSYTTVSVGLGGAEGWYGVSVFIMGSPGVPHQLGPQNLGFWGQAVILLIISYLYLKIPPALERDLGQMHPPCQAQESCPPPPEWGGEGAQPTLSSPRCWLMSSR